MLRIGSAAAITKKDQLVAMQEGGGKDFRHATDGGNRLCILQQSPLCVDGCLNNRADTRILRLASLSCMHPSCRIASADAFLAAMISWHGVEIRAARLYHDAQATGKYPEEHSTESKIH